MPGAAFWVTGGRDRVGKMSKIKSCMEMSVVSENSFF